MPDEPLKCDYFPREPRAYALIEVLASIARVPHIDGLLRKSPMQKKNHQRRDQKTPITVQPGRSEKRVKAA